MFARWAVIGANNIVRGWARVDGKCRRVGCEKCELASSLPEHKVGGVAVRYEALLCEAGKELVRLHVVRSPNFTIETKHLGNICEGFRRSMRGEMPRRQLSDMDGVYTQR